MSQAVSMVYSNRDLQSPSSILSCLVQHGSEFEQGISSSGQFSRRYSRIIELNPIEEERVWEYTGTPKENFFSAFISGAQPLPNGNRLICEGGPCRIFEVTRDKEIVWEHRSPYKKKGTYGIYMATRYPPEYVKPLLERAGKE